MALQWMLLAYTVAVEAAIAILLTVPSPKLLKKRFVSLISLILQPALFVVPFAGFQILDIYWKNEHRLMCTSEICTAAERDRYEKSIYKAQRNVILCVAACLLYWCIYRVCKYNKEIESLEEVEKRYKEHIFGNSIKESILRGTKHLFVRTSDLKFSSPTSSLFPPFLLSGTVHPPPSSRVSLILRARMEAAMATVIGSPVGAFARLNYTGRSGIFGNGLGFVRFPSLSHVPIRLCPQVSYSKLWNKKLGTGIRRSTIVKASMDAESSESGEPIAPLQLESPIGQFLTQILVSHPHLVPAAVEQQLDQLQNDRDAEGNNEASGSGTDLVLYRRIAEVKANERKQVLEEILYALVVQKFMDANVPLIPAITPSSSDVSGRVDTWAANDESLEHLHSPEAYEMIQNHLALILGNRVGDSTSVVQISKLRVGQVYAASVMYGYFLKRVDQRFQLEKTMKVLPKASNSEDSIIQQAIGEDVRPYVGENSPPVSPHPEITSWPDRDENSIGGFSQGLKASRLRNYVMAFDGETLQRYATIRSKEAVGIIEKHTEALFGRPEIAITPQGTIDPSKDEQLKISFGGLKGLVLEAVTFGSFLWDVESYVDSRYHFVVS